MTPFERRAAIAGLVVGAGSLGVAGLQYLSPPAAPPVALSTIPISVNVSTAAPVTPPPPSKLSQVLVAKTMGRQINFIEAIIGTAASVLGSWRYYEVEGCNLGLNVDKDNVIRGLRINIVPERCDFEWRDLYPSLGMLGSPSQNNIRQFVDKAGLSFVQGCLTSCGNAADPDVDFMVKGPHSADWVNVKVGFTTDSASEIQGTSRFANLVDANINSEASYDLSTVCDVREKAWAIQTMGALKVEYVELGYDDSMSFTYSDDKECDFVSLEMFRS